ncbi:unnamed protein product [Penicillium palitans]
MGAAGGGWSNEAITRVPAPAKGIYIWLAAIWHIIQWRSPWLQHCQHIRYHDLEAFCWIVSSMLLGQTAGVLIAGPLGERRGRKPVIMLSAIIYTIGTILMAVNFGSLAELLVGRILLGLGSGAGMVVGPIYISEIAPTEMRGTMTTFYNINIMAGVAGSYWINFGSLEQISAEDSWQWRATLVLQLIPAVVLLVGYIFFPESPRYLMMRGKPNAAYASLSRLRGLDDSSPYFEREFDEYKSRFDAGADSRSAFESFKSLLGSCITDPPTRKLLLFVTIIQTFFIMSGGNSITYYAPTILESIGLNSRQRLLFSAVYGMIKVASVFLYAFVLTDRFGRRPLLLIGSSINVICLCYLAVYLGVADLSGSNDPSAAAWVAIVAICFFAIGYGFGWAPAFSLTASEICPTPIRGTVVTIAFVYQNLLNLAITRGFPNMTHDMHAYGPFALFTAFTFVATCWVFVAFPECKGRSMENADTLFSMHWYKIGFSKVPEVSSEISTTTDVEKATSSEHAEHLNSEDDKGRKETH